jgi:hypothetical protein
LTNLFIIILFAEIEHEKELILFNIEVKETANIFQWNLQEAAERRQ